MSVESHSAVITARRISVQSVVLLSPVVRPSVCLSVTFVIFIFCNHRTCLKNRKLTIRPLSLDFGILQYLITLFLNNLFTFPYSIQKAYA